MRAFRPVLALAVTAMVGCERRTTITLVGHGPAPAAVTDELYSLFTQLMLGMASRPKADEDRLRVRTQWALSAMERATLDGVFEKLGPAEPDREAVTLLVETMHAPAGTAAKRTPTREGPPERLAITFDPSVAERTLRNIGGRGGEQLCSWEVEIHPAVPEHFTDALWDNPYLEPELRPYRVVTVEPATRPLAVRLRFHEPDRAAFVFARHADVYSVALGNRAPSQEFQECSQTIFTEADAFFLCNLVFPLTCGWLRAHSLEDSRI